jgi:HAD superfamily hydrolase (TIGR01509 family)
LIGVRICHDENMPLRAVLFDFDGLILDTETPEREGWQQVFRRFGLEFPDFLWMTMIGQSAPEILSLPFEYLEQTLGAPVDRETIAREAREIRVAIIDAKDAMPGAIEALGACEETGIRKVVVSSSGRKWVTRHLGRLGLLDRFEFLVCGYEGQPSKPAPDLYLKALEQLNLSPEECLALEDSPNGIRAAKAAGLYVVCVPNELTAQLDLSQADERLNSLAEWRPDGHLSQGAGSGNDIVKR